MTLLWIAIAWFTGIGLLRFLFPAPLRWSLHNVLLISLGAGVGMGIASCLYFLVLVSAGPNFVVLASVEGAALVAAAILAVRAKPRGEVLSFASGPKIAWYLNVLFFAALAIAATIFVTHSAAKPDGEWDAWSIWNLHARLLYRSGELWKHAFSSQLAWSHPDYPLLVPGMIAMSWTLAHSDSTLAPIAVAFLFTFGAAGTLIATLGVLRGKAQAWLGGALLLGTVAFVEIGAMQYADVPLSFFIVATLALLCLQDRYPSDARFTILAGLTAGLAAWTKNEGLLFVLAIVVARAVAMFRFGSRTAIARQAGALATGLAFPLAVVALFKLRFAPSDDLIAKGPSEIIAHLTDFSRWMTAFIEFGKAAWSFGRVVVNGQNEGGFLIPVVLVLLLYWFLVRFRVAENDRLPMATAALAVAVMLIGDFAVYILFPNDIEWQLLTSLDRILLQLWPAGVLAFFLAANVPQLAAQPKAAPKPKAARHGAKSQRRAAETR
jgi:hypothetical protein